MQWFDAAVRHGKKHTEEQDRAVDRHIPFAERHLVPDRFIAGELTRFETGKTRRVASIRNAGCLFEGLDARHARIRQRIISLFAKQIE